VRRGNSPGGNRDSSVEYLAVGMSAPSGLLDEFRQAGDILVYDVLPGEEPARGEDQK